MRKKLLAIAAVAVALGLAIVYFAMKDDTETHSTRISGAYQALTWLSAQRAYPDNTIPDVAQYAAYEYAQAKFPRALNKGGSDDQWETIGPHNLGGRTLALAFNPQNPNTIYAGSASGGLWRSFTAGVGVAAWELVPTGYPVLAVSSIAFASEDSNIIYIGTGEVYNYQNTGTGAAYRSTRGTYGIGILKSSDGGDSWEKSLDWSFNQKRGVQAVKVNPFNPNTVWAATTEGTYKSTDAGQTWNQVHQVVMANDLIISPLDTNIVVVGTGNFASAGHGIYRTIDGGQTWAQSVIGLPSTFAGKVHLAIAPSDPTNFYASIGNGFNPGINNASWLCRSFDSGFTWGIQTTQDYSRWQGWFSHDVAVSPNDPTELFAVGIDIHKSTNGGLNITQKSVGFPFRGRVEIGGEEGPANYSHSDHHDVVWHPTDPNTVYFAHDGGVNRTTDGGETFQALNGGYQTGQFYGGFSSAYTDSLLAMGGLQDNSTAVWDGQLAWIVRLIGGDGGWTAIDPTNADILYGSSQGLNVLKSTNRGQSFGNLGIPGTSGPTVFIAPFVVAFDDPQVIYAGRDVVFKSVDGGNSWQPTNNGSPLDGNPTLALAVSHQTSNVVYATTAPFSNLPGVYRSLNGGASWANISATLPNRYPMDIAVDPTNDATVYVVFSGFGTSHVFKSTTFGAAWEDIGSELPDLPTNAVIVDPDFPDHVYVGNDIGVYASTDGGNTWIDFNFGLPEAVMVFDLSISPLNRMLRVATHGNGAYQRKLIDGTPTGITENDGRPVAFKLDQNYPNPFSLVGAGGVATTTINYQLAEQRTVTVRIFDALGREVKAWEAGAKPAGNHQVVWDGTNNAGQHVAAGVYHYELRAGDFVQSRQLTVLR